jgi:hypothetical protein
MAKIAEIEIRATRRMGELLAQQPKANGAASGGKKRSSSRGSYVQPRGSGAPTLNDLGIDKRRSHVAQVVASVPVAEVER